MTMNNNYIEYSARRNQKEKIASHGLWLSDKIR